MRRDMMTARFKRDYVAYSAIFLFALVVMVEMAIAVMVPLQMHKQNLLAEEKSRITVQTYFDSLRRSMRNIIKDNNDPAIQGEASMILEQLDLLAIYLMTDDQSRKLSAEQIQQLREVFNSIARHRSRLSEKRAVTTPVELDAAGYIKAIAEEKI